MKLLKLTDWEDHIPSTTINHIIAMNLITFKPALLFSGLILLQLLLPCGLQAHPPAKEKTIRVLQFNIWQEGTVVEGGFQAVVDEIIRTGADLVCLSEVRNYNSCRLDQRLVEALAAKGHRYYADKSLDSGILSRYPIKQQWDFFPVINDKGSITKALIDLDGHEVALYSAHVDYRHCSLYLPRGYDGSTWDEMPVPITDTAMIGADNLKSNRDEAIDAFIKDAKLEKQKGRIVILGGDFNEPSHLD